MKPGVNGKDRFRVSTSGQIADEIKSLLPIAVEQGKEDSFYQGLEAIYKTLENEPGKFGEPLYHLKNLNLEMRAGIISPFAVTYGVNYAARTVFISKVTLL
jgi:hypothetical protein